MIRCVSDIMVTDFPVVDVLAGVRQVQHMTVENQYASLVVQEFNQVVGILTYWDLVEAHPNRIVADAMSDQVIYIAPAMPVWEAQEILDQEVLNYC